MRVAVVTDAWRPQVNGVVRTLTQTGLELERAGHVVRHIGPDGFRSLPCPTYPEIRLAVLPRARLERELDDFAPDTLHVATEGPLGMAARAICRDRGWRFTTSYHTQFPQYLRLRAPIPERWTYRWLRGFHASGARTLAPTPSVVRELEAHGFANVALWGRGVDIERFKPGDRDAFPDLPRPICLYVGRVAVEKNLDAFLDARLPGSKVVVGIGPDLERLKKAHPGVLFTGYRDNGALAACYRSADVFVFPSRTDTFGLVMLEALASGVPVAAFPVTGPIDVIEDDVTGALDEDLGRAVDRALGIDPRACRRHAESKSWGAIARQFAEHLVPLR